MADDPSPIPRPFDVRTVKFLVRLMSRHDLREIDLREGDLRIRLLRGTNEPAPSAPPTAPQPIAIPAAATPVPPPTAIPAPAARPTVEIKSEGVGTFYVAAEPGEPPYVTKGSRVTPTTVVGQIEAMKLFTAITAGCTGVITEVLVANEQYVDYGCVLFRVDPG